MKKFVSSVTIMMLFRIAFAQLDNKENIFTFAEQMPAFPGGQSEMMKFLKQNLRYPKAAKEEGMEAKIVSSFVVNVDGSISDIKIISGIDSLGFNEEVIRVIKQMPGWIPGKQGGKNVAVYFNLPVTFKLEGDKKDLNKNTETNSSVLKSSENYVLSASGEKIYKNAEIMPEFPGGDKELITFLNKNLKYPSDARENGVQGREVVQFAVNTDGSISDITIKNSLSKSCDEEVMRIIKMMPLWKPGMKEDVTVPVYYMLPISFKLNK